MKDTVRLIIVEDHDLTRMGLEAALQRREGIEVIGEAANGLQGLKLLQTQKPDLAIIDIGLPDIDGIELLRRFRDQPAEGNPDTKILMLTMHSAEDSVMAAFAAGADAYCMKDINMDKLEEAIRLTHEGHPWIDPAIANVVLQYVRKNEAPRLPDNEKTVQIKALAPEYEIVVDQADLTSREIGILQLIVQGYSNAEIADNLFLTVGTIKTHVRHILQKLCVDDRTHAAVIALRAGLIE
jgi:two-component system, NarL family, response regulator LiaR